MCSAMADSTTPDRDLTARARIRDTAIRVFGEQGFATGVRAIATAAGVSPGLVNHHFGSKDGLRAECDAHVLEIIREQKAQAMSTPGPAGAIAALSELEQYAPVVAYMVRSFQAGGRLAESLFEHMVADTEEYLAIGVRSGKLRASRDPKARARYLTLNNVGALLLYLQIRADREGTLDYATAIRDLSDEITLPALEMYAEGIFTDSALLDAFLATDAGAPKSHPDAEPPTEEMP
ncbi:TetR family transcriptional regulator [Rhodococcus sp. NPDC055112]